MVRVAERYLEREVKLDVDDAFRVPDLDDLAPPGGVLDTVQLTLDSTYFDTAPRDLLAADVTLRCRSGGLTDTGWQLKLPSGDARTEMRLPRGEGAGVPKELRDLTAGLRRGRGLRQLARIRTERSVYRLSDANGRLLVEVADDRVSATTLGDTAIISTWREIEVELADGGAGLNRTIVKRLREAGAQPSTSSSKLARAVGQLVADRPSPAAAAQGCTVGDLVLAYLLEQRQGLLTGDVDLRDGSDAIHPTRVATRRWRSTLRTFGALFEAERVSALDGELAWYAAVLGAVRDPDVLRTHLRGVIAELPDHVVLGPVANRVEQHLISEREHHRRTLLRALNGRRYYALLDALDSWIADPPFTAAAGEPRARAGKLAAGAQKKLDRQLRVAASHDDVEHVHRARKAAKRARYAFELAAPALATKAAKRRIAKIKVIQDTLGEFQDSVVATETLLRMGIRAGTSPNENGFSYGLLYALEQQRAEAVRRRVLDKLR
ncbi:MAG: adenylate cyclase [Pseudonocardiales bacterium]|nr:MAG: adenylate cyclase [Pseudonocardiales bacterium]